MLDELLRLFYGAFSLMGYYFTLQADIYYNSTTSIGIHHGSPAGDGKYPFVVSIYYENEYLCTGSILSERTIGSAVHCFNFPEKPEKYYIKAGGYEFDSGERYEISLIKNHGDYDPHSEKLDIGIMQIKGKFDFSNPKIAPIDLVSQRVRAKTNCIFLGFGAVDSTGTPPPCLMKTTLPIVDLTTCKNYVTDKVFSSNLCAGFMSGQSDRNPCHGDSGGPLICRNPTTSKYELAGTMSWNVENCQLTRVVTVFTDTFNYDVVEFIKSYL